MWHETYEYRKNAMISYYDIRNSMIVNTIHGFYQSEKDVWEDWKRNWMIITIKKIIRENMQQY